jgi:hypothetical protein
MGGNSVEDGGDEAARGDAVGGGGAGGGNEVINEMEGAGETSPSNCGLARRLATTAARLLLAWLASELRLATKFREFLRNFLFFFSRYLSEILRNFDFVKRRKDS